MLDKVMIDCCYHQNNTKRSFFQRFDNSSQYSKVFSSSWEIFTKDVGNQKSSDRKTMIKILKINKNYVKKRSSYFNMYC